MTTALFFGSFNPIHIGHLIIADTIALSKHVKEVWFVVSPQNPFKEKKGLLHEEIRKDLIDLAIKGKSKLKTSDIESSLPIPSYTIDTLKALKKKYPKRKFSIIMGEDNLKNFHKWKDYKDILEICKLVVYPRPGYKTRRLKNHPSVSTLDVPLLGISSTIIRERLSKGQAISYLTPESVEKSITSRKLYRD